MIRINGKGRVGNTPAITASKSGKPFIKVACYFYNGKNGNDYNESGQINLTAFGNVAMQLAAVNIDKGDEIIFTAELREDFWLSQELDQNGQPIKNRKISAIIDTAAVTKKNIIESVKNAAQPQQQFNQQQFNQPVQQPRQRQVQQQFNQPQPQPQQFNQNQQFQTFDLTDDDLPF